MNGGTCIYELQNGVWNVTDNCNAGRGCVSAQSIKPNAAHPQITVPVTNHNGVTGSIVFAATSVTVDSTVLGKSVQVVDGMTRTIVAAGTAVQFTKPTVVPRFGIRVNCEGGQDFTTDHFPSTDLPQPATAASPEMI